MTSIAGTDNLAWSDEQTRFYLQLRVDEKLKGNIRKDKVNDVAIQSIIDKFAETFGERHPWRKFGIKYTTCKKQYESFRKLTHNRTRLGYHSNGSIDMFEDWWNERCKVLVVMSRYQSCTLQEIIDHMENTFHQPDSLTLPMRVDLACNALEQLLKDEIVDIEKKQ
ncbi:uncharacterized protein LOC112082202 [Eutrema salsugineum]|uniref:uncharacterized protein LOC112082202 n=1 Tax=Eutrema salsugineum TaxID=72664 RepID=UPI000CED18C6|nr:uncharacterized protein LOC112082202 [Eutrema salsugineum]